jgi:hypothetical protein
MVWTGSIWLMIGSFCVDEYPALLTGVSHWLYLGSIGLRTMFHSVRLEALTANKCAKIFFGGDEPCQY